MGGICSGGNGWAAKSSDAWGNVAAQMMALPSHWTPDPQFPKEWFHVVTARRLQDNPSLCTLARLEAVACLPKERATAILVLLLRLLMARPTLQSHPSQLADELRQRLLEDWEEPTSVICGRSITLAPCHPCVALRV